MDNQSLLAQVQDERAAKRIAAGAADRFRDVVSEILGLDENPGDDELMAQLRSLHGKSGPEPYRWRNFCAGALAIIDQIHAMPEPERIELEDET